MSDEPERKVYRGEVLPPETSRQVSIPDLPPGTPLGMPMLGRMKYEANARALRAYINFRVEQRTLIETETSLNGAMQNHVASKERLAASLQRHKHIDKILAADEAKLLAGLSAVFEDIADAAREKAEAKEDNALERRIMRARLEAELFDAQAELERRRNPPAPKVDAEAALSPAQRAIRDIARVKKDRDELRAMLIEAAGGEDQLTDDDRAHLDTLELSAENKIREIMEGL